MTLAESLLSNGVLPTFDHPALAVRPILPGASAFSSSTVIVSHRLSIAAQTRAPFARLAVAREANMAENLSAFVAYFRDIDAMLRQERAALFFSQTHGLVLKRNFGFCEVDRYALEFAQHIEPDYTFAAD